ncbi:lipocalin [Sulfitobacter donghicola DSW-25 = KCTC 12864 = JCM 14565]|uniref:Lipocalin n=1 Tax=Sulfitobacter donghicola DSW-25 = KCTC 12864 = JCM 14565 TaxID=1300350 RepID=A0A073II44_9RHOB|nr:lipocalin [Sulfitobacter donghicola DSW-25 = KCTC 12864 = JCM 14565]
MRGALLAGLMALGACAVEPPAPVPVGPSYRDQTALIGVTSRFDADKFAGVWYIRAGFDPALGKMAFRMIDTPNGHAMRLGAFVCDGAGVCGDYSQDLPAAKKGKGRYAVQMPDGNTRDFWVLWVDEGFRTAVLGNKSGDFGWIVDRSTKGGSDRIKAAKEILDFNGYDVSQLKVVR